MPGKLPGRLTKPLETLGFSRRLGIQGWIMYKLLLCWRYLKTRYLAMACIISVMLGVATLIVVNSVMSGFSTRLRDRLHGLLSDVVIEAHGMEGFADPRGKMAKIRRHAYLGPRI